MGGNVADYSVVRDGQFSIDASGSDDERLNVSLPGKVLPEQSSILSFRINSANDLRLRIAVNDRTVHEENIVNGVVERTLQEILSTNILRKNERNTLTFTAVRGRGQLSDVILWYQRST